MNMDKQTFISNIRASGTNITDYTNFILTIVKQETDNNNIITNRSISCYSYIIGLSFIFSIDIRLLTSRSYDDIYDIIDEALIRYKFESLLEYI